MFDYSKFAKHCYWDGETHIVICQNGHKLLAVAWYDEDADWFKIQIYKWEKSDELYGT